MVEKKNPISGKWLLVNEIILLGSGRKKMFLQYFLVIGKLGKTKNGGPLTLNLFILASTSVQMNEEWR